MNPEKIVELINSAREVMGLRPITVEQYQTGLRENTLEVARHNATQEAGRLARVRIALGKKYSKVQTGNPLARCYFYLMREEKTPEDIQYNVNLHAKIQTKEGIAEVIEDICRQITQLPPAVFFPKDEAEMISNYEKYGGLYDTMMNMELMRADMRTSGIAVHPVIDQFLESHSGLFDVCGKMASLVKFWSSPFYTAFGDTDKFSMIMVAAGSNKEDKSIEQTEFSLFAENSMGPAQFAIEKDVMRGAVIMRGNGDAESHVYAAENVYDYASTAEANTRRLKVMDEDAKREFDAILAGKFSMSRKSYITLKAERLLNRGVMSAEHEINYNEADRKLVKLFGPVFEFDDTNLANEVYTRDNFVVSNYNLPENCPFSEAEAAFIGLASMSLEGIGDISRQDMPAGMRLAVNNSNCTENMISGTPRQGAGRLLRDSIDAARRNVTPIIKSYMEGDKRPLAVALASVVKVTAESFNGTSVLKVNSGFDGKIMGQALDMIARDPEMRMIVKNEGLISDRAMKTAEVGRKLSKFYEERYTMLDRFKREVSEGREPSAELKKALVTRTLAIDYLSAQKSKDISINRATPEYVAETGKINAWFDAHKKEPGATTEMTARFAALDRQAPVSAFMEKIILPNGLACFENAIGNTEQAQKAMAMSADELIKAVGLNSAHEVFNGNLSKSAAKELNDTGVIANFLSSVVMDNPNAAQPATKKNLYEDERNLYNLYAGITNAQKDVHMGSREFDNVELDIKLIEKANRKLIENPSLLTKENADVMKRSYEMLAADCNTYLRRKERQGKLNAAPNSKTGKRIKMVREALKLSEQGKAKFAVTGKFIEHSQEEKNLQEQAERLLYESLTPENAGRLMKSLNNMAEENADRTRGQKIVAQLNVVTKYINDKGLEMRDCGLAIQDYQKMTEVMRAGGTLNVPASNNGAIQNNGPTV